MCLTFITFDVFTSTRYAGNPLAIVHVPAEHRTTLTQAQKQHIAQEFNLSETVFLHEASSGPVHIDIFTPFAEIPFAGHPTIGTAWYLLQHLRRNVSSLQTKAGLIPISLLPDGRVKAEIPHNVHVHSRTIANPVTNAANPIVSIVKGMSFILAPLPSLSALGAARESLYPETYDPSILDAGWQEGLIGTLFYVPVPVDASSFPSLSEEHRAFRTRMHASGEDPATGSASSALGAYLALREESENGEGKGMFKYLLTQGVEMGRKSEIVVEVKVVNGQEVEGIWLSGGAVRVMWGGLEV